IYRTYYYIYFTFYFFLLHMVVIVFFLTVISCPLPSHCFPHFDAELFCIRTTSLKESRNILVLPFLMCLLWRHHVAGHMWPKMIVYVDCFDQLVKRSFVVWKSLGHPIFVF